MTTGTPPQEALREPSFGEAAKRLLTEGSDSKTGNSRSLRTGPPNELARCGPMDFAKAIAHLCAMKRTANLTKIEADAWHAVLGGFSPRVLNRAVLDLALSESQFPDLGDLYQACRRVAIRLGEIKEPYSPHAGTVENRGPTSDELARIATALGLQV